MDVRRMKGNACSHHINQRPALIRLSSFFIRLKHRSSTLRNTMTSLSGTSFSKGTHRMFQEMRVVHCDHLFSQLVTEVMCGFWVSSELHVLKTAQRSWVEFMVTWICWAHPRSFLVGRSGEGEELTICMSSKFPGDSGAAGPGSKFQTIGLEDIFPYSSKHPQ